MFYEIKSGEKSMFSSSYNISSLMAQFAEVTLETEMMKISKNIFLHLKLIVMR